MQENSTPGTAQAVANVAPLKAREVAAALRVDVSTVYLAIRQGDLTAYRVGAGRGTIRISRAAFDEYVAERGIPASELAVAL
ncbi:helix-turn-helix domain-containing protein [Streptomyces erythrochromogenes]|jgi:excisionase family DNA binding protein|uniref:helix-turn-helix domain-containing protein n=1 Tax=Streptomyces erythrochromogenes TaxID=285574 RepID=UPI002250C789|nr:helix-turn-helix domain-containing protein [Streptomyces erythrochromogenes]MCX5584255.1 helix-turn-helix domain-containing protein [Streptomyces erythrochromogenes]